MGVWLKRTLNQLQLKKRDVYFTTLFQSNTFAKERSGNLRIVLVTDTIGGVACTFYH